MGAGLALGLRTNAISAAGHCWERVARGAEDEIAVIDETSPFHQLLPREWSGTTGRAGIW